MAGYVIHVVIAKEYIKKHKIENEEEFINGTIFPDSVKIKGETHYSEFYSSDTNPYKFLLENKLDNFFNLGYFLHLIVDSIFYNKYFLLPNHNMAEIIHNDYDILNKKLLEKYGNIDFPEEIQQYVSIKEGKLQFLNEEKLEKCIEEASSYDLIKLAEEILKEKDYKKILGVR